MFVCMSVCVYNKCVLCKGKSVRVRAGKISLSSTNNNNAIECGGWGTCTLSRSGQGACAREKNRDYKLQKRRKKVRKNQGNNSHSPANEIRDESNK